MKFNLSIAEELDDAWRPIIEHQFNLTLSPLAASLIGPKVTFEAIEERHGLEYRCALKARLSNGTALELSSRHPEGRTAICSVFMRARRDVTRRRRSRSGPVQISRRAAPSPLP